VERSAGYTLTSVLDADGVGTQVGWSVRHDVRSVSVVLNLRTYVVRLRVLTSSNTKVRRLVKFNASHNAPRSRNATRSSSVVTLSRPPTSSSPRITNRSFRYASPHLWNQLPVSFRQPCTKHPADDVTLCNSPPTCSPLSPSITHSLFHSRLKTHLFHKSFPPVC